MEDLLWWLGLYCSDAAQQQQTIFPIDYVPHNFPISGTDYLID